MRTVIRLPTLALLLVGGCASISQELEQFEYHGQFCGPKYPDISNTLTKSEHIDWLSSIYEPIDDLDRVCKRHDICYAQAQGESEESIDLDKIIRCDKSLIKEAKPIEKYFWKERRKSIRPRDIKTKEGRAKIDDTLRCYTLAQGMTNAFRAKLKKADGIAGAPLAPLSFGLGLFASSKHSKELRCDKKAN